ncbi:hypothetical protein GCM10011581_32810 [Saccharopolyspora subtropica]|uniref:Uncharacterized protein n=1 Tax=Saccharopolyspora thermophila TaxID=89367 RepID=A0A917K189_9PSEU|nr:hypothetical protein [Saccharopolyspora subtropica]GGI93151.1 hypothetical protein GCM10011581_32810 [Saccharopolyspora subtropica]
MTEPVQRVDAFGRPLPDQRPQAPQSLLRARWLWIGAVLIGMVQAFVQLVDRPRLIAQLRQLQPELGQEELDAAANSGIMFTFLLKAMILLAYVLLSRRMLEGRNWARVVLTVFGGFGVFNALVTVLTVAVVGPDLIRELSGVTITGADVAFSLAVMAADLAAIVLMYLPESNRFMRAARGGHAPEHPRSGWS